MEWLAGSCRPGAARAARRGLPLSLCAATFAAAFGCASWDAARLYASGTQALDRGELTLAEVQLGEAARLAPQASEVRNHLGLVYAAQQRPVLAERAFREALRLDCDNDAARRNLAALQRGRQGASAARRAAAPEGEPR